MRIDGAILIELRERTVPGLQIELAVKCGQFVEHRLEFVSIGDIALPGLEQTLALLAACQLELPVSFGGPQPPLGNHDNYPYGCNPLQKGSRILTLAM